MSKRKLIPSVKYHRHVKCPNTWNKWFTVRTLWSGNLLYIIVKNHQLTFDFRKDWVSDMMGDSNE